jgi:zinc D-Ala-D-Ala dipeptidase
MNTKGFLLSKYFIIICLVFKMTSCETTQKNKQNVISNLNEDSISVENSFNGISAYERMLIEQGLIDIHSIDTTIVVDLKYSTEDNFMGENMYGDFKKCYLQTETAQMLSNAQKLLKQVDSNLTLVVFDAVRPLEIQKKMWKSGKLPKEERNTFITNPDIYSLHNFGAAVDVSIMLNDGSLLDMGTDFDHIGELAYPSLEQYFLDNGMLGQNQIENRKILRSAMRQSGFIANKYEWWHFVSCYRVEALKKYPIIESFNSVIMPNIEKSNNLENNLSFKVQLAASHRKLNSSHPSLRGVDYKEYFHQGMYKYTTGEFNSLSATYEYRDSLKNRGYEAFVVCFFNGERIDIREAMAKMQ